MNDVFFESVRYSMISCSKAIELHLVLNGFTLLLKLLCHMHNASVHRMQICVSCVTHLDVILFKVVARFLSCEHPDVHTKC